MRTTTFPVLALVILSMLPTCLPAAAASPLAEIHLDAHQIMILPSESTLGIQLSISGPNDFFHRQTVPPGAEPLVILVGEGGLDLVDGSYSYELRALPGQLVSRTSQRGTITGSGAHDGQRPPAGTVQTGSFLMAGGAIAELDPQTREAMEKDILQLDDVIVDGSLCIGIDCANGEQFGDDVLRLKENNIRVHFWDTSDDSGTFPKNDWEININDATDGGESRFSVVDLDAATTPFTIRAGAPSSSLLVDSSGRLGLGTSTPATDVHVVDGDTPTIRLEQDSSTSHTPQTWEIAGNDTGLAFADVTAGPTLPFRIQPGAPTSSLEVAADGAIGVGTSTPEARLHVIGADSDVLTLENVGNVKIILEDTGGGADDHKWAINNARTLRFAADDPQIAQMALDVNGNLVIQGSLTTATSTYPDFVLEPGYPLMPFDELEEYIRSYGHLPAIPTAEQTGNGRSVNISELQIKLLQKIEELTLYTLDQQRQIQAQRDTIDQLSTAITDLRERLTSVEAAPD